MLIPPSPELYRQIEETYNDEFLEKVFAKLKIDNSVERAEFKKIAVIASAGYLQFLENNNERLQPSAQELLLEKYKKALKAVSEIYLEINNDAATRVKFHDTLQEEYNKQTPIMQQVLSPYQDHHSYTETFFYNLLDILADVAEKAKTRNIGNDDAIVSGDALAWWIAVILHNWPKSSPIKIQIGDYKSPCRDILYMLMQRIDSVTEKNIKTAMRKAVIAGQVQFPAKLLLK